MKKVTMAFGYDAIPNPLSTEITKIKEAHGREIDSWKKREEIYQKTLGNITGINENDIYINGNYVEYMP